MESIDYKMSIIIRTDLCMSPGKIAAQACHACLETSEKARRRKIWKIWHRKGAKKVILKVKSREELFKLKNKAEKAGLPNSLIIDKGLTEIPPNTATSLGIGPAESKMIDKITGNLSLL
jgi:PTH2 family peptidyl-tRNA hydrolase